MLALEAPPHWADGHVEDIRGIRESLEPNGYWEDVSTLQNEADDCTLQKAATVTKKCREGAWLMDGVARVRSVGEAGVQRRTGQKRNLKHEKREGTAISM